MDFCAVFTVEKDGVLPKKNNDRLGGQLGAG